MRCQRRPPFGSDFCPRTARPRIPQRRQYLKLPFGLFRASPFAPFPVYARSVGGVNSNGG
eukprot:3781771-Prymnesium_polylepis.1